MQTKKTTTWVMLAALPLFAAAMSAGCEDEKDPEIPGGMTGMTPSATEVTISEDVSASTTWDKPTYILKQKIFVTNGATLTIAPGTKVLGDAAATDKAALIVTRGAKLIAKGTKEKPIIFSSSNPEGSRVSGDWAGVALNGSARINGGSACTGGTGADCREANLEGLPTSESRGLFGGTDDASSCGEIQYARIEFAGAIFTEGKELNGLTLAGCGSATKISYVQIHRGKDDGIEFFGGTASVDHIVITGAEDDNLDWDFGWTGTAQFVIVHQYNHPDADNGFEGSNNIMNEAATPVSAPKLSNITLISEGGPKSRAMHLKEGTRGKMRNLIIQGFKFDVVNFTAKTASVAADWPSNLSIESSYFFGNGPYKNDSAMDDDANFADQTAVEDPARNNKMDVDPQFTSLDQASPNFVPKAIMAGSAPDFGDVSATYAGALKPNETAPWTAGWTAYPTN